MLSIGLDPMEFLNETDGFKQALYASIAQEAVKLQEQRDKSLATAIANNLGRIIGG